MNHQVDTLGTISSYDWRTYGHNYGKFPTIIPKNYEKLQNLTTGRQVRTPVEAPGGPIKFFV